LTGITDTLFIKSSREIFCCFYFTTTLHRKRAALVS